MTSASQKAKPACVIARHANALQTNPSLNASIMTATALRVAVTINVKGSVATR